MGRLHQTDRQSGEQSARGIAPEGGYLTDGMALFHVERTLVDGPAGELLIELEDCVTLELIVCSAQTVAELGMRGVQPLKL